MEAMEEDDIQFESDDESLEDGDEDDEPQLPREEERYNKLMEKLHSNDKDMGCVTIYRDVLGFILNEGKIDDFCSALRLASSLEDLDIGHVLLVGDRNAIADTIEITQENSQALNKLIEAIHFIRHRLTCLYLGFLGEVDSLLLCLILFWASHDSLQPQLEVPWHCTVDRDMERLIRAVHLPSVEYEVINLTFVGTSDSQERRDDGDQSQQRLHINCDLLWRLMRLDKPTPYVTFEQIDFTLAGCKYIEEILLSKPYESVDFVTIDRCTFPTDGCKMISSAIGRSSSLCALFLRDVFVDEEFCQDLIRNIPLSNSLDDLTIGFDNDDSTSMEEKEKFLVNLLKAVMKQNNEVLERISLEFLPESAQLFSEEHQLELLPFLQGNYVPKTIEIDDEVLPVFETVLRLNRAGRRYLIEDSASKESCIKLLAKVNDHLDSLFFRLRENPILFTADDEQDVECGFWCQIL